MEGGRRKGRWEKGGRRGDDLRKGGGGRTHDPGEGGKVEGERCPKGGRKDRFCDLKGRKGSGRREVV